MLWLTLLRLSLLRHSVLPRGALRSLFLLRLLLLRTRCPIRVTVGTYRRCSGAIHCRGLRVLRLLHLLYTVPRDHCRLTHLPRNRVLP